MIKKMLILVAAIMPVAATVRAEVPTPRAVNVFYNGMEQLTRIYSSGEASEIETQMRKCFKDEFDSGIELPNDFKFFRHDEGSISHTNKILTSTTYIAKLGEYAFKDKVLKVNVRIIKSEETGRMPEFKSGSISSSETYTYVNTLVEKTFQIKGKEWTYNDTVSTNVSTGLIETISNGNGMLDANALRVKAAIAYERKRYGEAYRLYEQIISIAPDDADAYYRLGLMTYWLQGCESKFRKKKYAHNKGKEYLTLAWQKGTGAISMKAKRVLHWMYNPYI